MKLYLLPTLFIILAACSPTTTSGGESVAEVATPQAPVDSGDGATASDAGDTDTRPAWYNHPLTDARSGEAFTLADFEGKTVFVEVMATWCPPCRAALQNLGQAKAQLDSDSHVFIALSVETNLPNSTLAQYANDNGFDWTFAVVSPEMLRDLTASFGPAIANPPATPHFIIRPDGAVSGGLVTGIHPPEALIAEINAASGV